MFHSRCLPVLALLLSLSAGCGGIHPTSTSGSGVRIIENTNTLRVEINNQLFTEYHFNDAARPYFYPIIGPDNLPMTRKWPMESPEGEEHDHPHHRSLWYAHGDVNGVNFWTDEIADQIDKTKGVHGSVTPKVDAANELPFGKIVHDKFTEIKSGLESGVIKSRDNWVGADGAIVCTDDRTFRIYNHPGMRLFDFEITIHAPRGAVTFGDTKEGTMAIRLAETMRLNKSKGIVGLGHIVNSEGVRDAQTWGKRADWCDYYGPVDGKIVGVAIFDNPNNPLHPTSWHVRNYGLFAVNPFGLHDFEKKPAHTGDFTIPAGQSATFRYRFYLHEGDEKRARVAEMYADYANSAKSKTK
jgi:hypothetical protein